MLMLLACVAAPAAASNWAQITGANRQNMVSSADTPWTRRWGFASTVLDGVKPSEDQPWVPDEKRSKFFIMGGDDFILPRDRRVETYGKTPEGDAKDPNYPPVDMTYPEDGGGGLRNDVWYTVGRSYQQFDDYRLRTRFGYPTPRLVSNASWVRMKEWEGIPFNIDTWRDYLACCHPTVPFPCGTPELCVTRGFDPFRLDRRWSPRRGAVAVTFYYTDERPPVIVLMGGRARSYQRMGGEELTGGLVGDQYDPSLTKRDRTRLMNDVWISADGETWDFTNPGCYVNQLEHSKGPGTAAQQCSTDFDCWRAGLGNAQCTQWNDLNPDLMMCVCKHWTPRERFAAGAFSGALYISGGIAATPEYRCGLYTCSRDYGTYLTDVWRSTDLGRNWVMLTPSALVADQYGRADHAMLFSGKLWWIIGGRGRDNDNRQVDVLFNNVYSSSDGSEWVQNVSSSRWSPRAAFAVAGSASTLYLFGGVEAVPPPPPPVDLNVVEEVEAAAALAPTNIQRDIKQIAVKPLPGERVNELQVTSLNDFYTLFTDDVAAVSATFPGAIRNIWYKDFDNPLAPHYAYFDAREHKLVARLPALNVTDDELAAFEAVGITTVMELARIDAGIVQRMRDPDDIDMQDICAYMRRAQALVAHCEVHPRPYDGEWMRGISIIDQIGIAPSPDPRDDGCLDVPAAAVVNYSAVGDVVCRSLPSPRRHFAMGVLDGLIYLAGGWEARDDLANDAWYRDDVLPHTIITRFPADQGHDSVTAFVSNEPYVVFEARFIDVESGAVTRNWSRVPTPFDTYGVNTPRRLTRMEVRAVDAAGNRDTSFELGVNVYEWTYVPPFPLLAVVLSILFLLLAIIFGVWYYRRWLRLRALAEYMRRRNMKKEKRKKKAFRREKRKRLKRAPALNAISEHDAEVRDKFKELTRGRPGRGREERAEQIGVTVAALDPVPVRRGPFGPRYEDEVWNVARRRTAKEALAFEGSAGMQIAATTAKEVAKVKQEYLVEADNARRAFRSQTHGLRDDQAADKMRGALQIHSEVLAAKSAGTQGMQRVPPNLAAKAAELRARAMGLTGAPPGAKPLALTNGPMPPGAGKAAGAKPPGSAAPVKPGAVISAQAGGAAPVSRMLPPAGPSLGASIAAKAGAGAGTLNLGGGARSGPGGGNPAFAASMARTGAPPTPGLSAAAGMRPRGPPAPGGPPPGAAPGGDGRKLR